MSARLDALNVGESRPLVHRSRSVPSGIVKAPVSEPLKLSRTGLAGDAQADLENRGGPAKAVCVYQLLRLVVVAKKVDNSVLSSQ